MRPALNRMIRRRAVVDDRGTIARLFVSVWLVLTIHFATNISREHYPAITLAENGTLAVDPYLDLHPDLFVAPTGRAVINNTPGASVLAAAPLFLARPLMRFAEQAALRRLPADRSAVSAEYRDDRPNRQQFFRLVRERGLDLKFGVVAVVTAAGLMAPLTALLAIVMFKVLLALEMPPNRAILYAALVVFGTPVFFRAAYLNQNHLQGLFVFFAFVLLWPRRTTTPGRLILAGLLGGWGVVLDYSGVIPLAFLTWWVAVETSSDQRRASALRRVVCFGVGAAGPLLFLTAYQSWALGHPLAVPQSFMPADQYSNLGYSGMSLPQPDMIAANLIDLRFGLFAFGPLLLLAIPGVWLMPRAWLSARQTAAIVAFCVAYLLFCSANQFGRLQWNTGFRYLLPLVPFLFLYVVPVLERMRRRIAVPIIAAAVAYSWVLAMVRESVPVSVARLVSEGPQLPWLTVLERTAAQYGVASRLLPVAILGATAITLALIWTIPRRAGRTAS